MGDDVESKEVAVDPLSTHRCLQQSLVLVYRQAEQGEALWVLGSPGRSQVMERQEVGLLLRPVTPPGLNLACNIPARQGYQLYFAEGKQAQRGEVPGSHSKAESGGFPGLSDSRAQTPSIEPQYFVSWGEREQRCLGGSEQRGYIGNMKNGTNERHKVTQRL